LQVLRKASRISVTRVALAGQQQKMKQQWCWSTLRHVVWPSTHICTFKLFKHEERFKKNVSEILLQQDNARPHTRFKTREESRHSSTSNTQSRSCFLILITPLRIPQKCHPWAKAWGWWRCC
jgi:hypothetical protein